MPACGRGPNTGNWASTKLSKNQTIVSWPSFLQLLKHKSKQKGKSVEQGELGKKIGTNAKNTKERRKNKLPILGQGFWPQIGRFLRRIMDYLTKKTAIKW
jgi:hypothetical protein